MKTVRLFSLVGLLLCWLAGCNTTVTPTATPLPTAVPPTPTRPTAGVWVDAAEAVGPISPYLYGINYGPWMSVPVGVQEQFAQSGLTFIRFPGGRWGDTYNIEEAQLDLMMTYARQINAEPHVCVRLLGGTPEQAVALIQYANQEKGYNIKYWSIGNEPSLYESLQNEAGYDTMRYNEEWRAFATAMKAADPSIQLIGPNVHQFEANPAARPKDKNGRDWMEEFLKANGDLVDVVAFHRYPFPGDSKIPAPAFEALRDNSAEWDEIVPALRQLIVETTGREIPIAVMEVNSNWTDASGGKTTPDSLPNAIWWGDVLSRMVRQGVEYSAYFRLHSNDGRSGHGILARSDVRPSYYVFQLYKQFGQTQLASDSHENYVTVAAAKREDGSLTVMLVNRFENELTVPFTLTNWSGSTTAELFRLDAEHNADSLGSITPGSSLTLPGQSISLLIFSK